MTLGVAIDGFAVGDLWHAGVELKLVLLQHARELGSQMHVPEPPNHGFVGAGVTLHLETGVFKFKFVQNIEQPLLVALAPCLHRQTMHGLWKSQWFEVNVILVVRVMQHAIEFNFVHLGNGADVTRHQVCDFDVILALKAIQMRDLEGFPGRSNKQLGVAPDRSLVHPKDPQLANEGVDHDLENVGQNMHFIIGLGLEGFRLGVGFGTVKRWRVALGRIRGKSRQSVHQLRYASTGLGRNKQDRDQVTRAQSPFKRRM